MLERFFKKKPPSSVLRELVDEALFAKDPAAAILDAALVVRRAGLEHLVGTVTRGEALALARAGETISQERAVDLVAKLCDPGGALEPFDGGRRKRRQVLDEAKAQARGGR